MISCITNAIWKMTPIQGSLWVSRLEFVLIVGRSSKMYKVHQWPWTVTSIKYKYIQLFTFSVIPYIKNIFCLYGLDIWRLIFHGCCEWISGKALVLIRGGVSCVCIPTDQSLFGNVANSGHLIHEDKRSGQPLVSDLRSYPSSWHRGTARARTYFKAPADPHPNMWHMWGQKGVGYITCTMQRMQPAVVNDHKMVVIHEL